MRRHVLDPRPVLQRVRRRVGTRTTRSGAVRRVIPVGTSGVLDLLTRVAAERMKTGRLGPCSARDFGCDRCDASVCCSAARLRWGGAHQAPVRDYLERDPGAPPARDYVVLQLLKSTLPTSARHLGEIAANAPAPLWSLSVSFPLARDMF